VPVLVITIPVVFVVTPSGAITCITIDVLPLLRVIGYDGDPLTVASPLTVIVALGSDAVTVTVTAEVCGLTADV